MGELSTFITAIGALLTAIAFSSTAVLSALSYWETRRTKDAIRATTAAVEAQGHVMKQLEVQGNNNATELIKASAKINMALGIQNESTAQAKGETLVNTKLHESDLDLPKALPNPTPTEMPVKA